MDDHEEIPVVSMAEWVLYHLRKNVGHKKIAQIFADDGTAMTYEELLQQSVCVAEGLRAMGFKSGELVSIIARCSHEISPLMIGFVLVDVLIAASEVELNVDQLSQNLAQIKPRHIVTTDGKLSDVQKATADFDAQPLFYNMQELFKEALQKGSKARVDKFQPTKIADPSNHSYACFFSSGTSGLQKAILANDYEHIRSAYLRSRFAEKFEGPLLITCQPYWTTWWVNLLRLLLFCRTRIFVDKCSPESVLEAIHKHRPEVWYDLPHIMEAVMQLIEQNPGKWDTSSLKLLVVVGDYCGPTTTTKFMDKFKVNVIQEYGSTEMGSPVATPLDRPPVLGSIGKPTRLCKLVDIETGEVITEPNKPGELRVEYTAMNGYVNNPEATRNAFDEEGWFKTGDCVYRNEDGFLFFVARLKDMMKPYGYSVGPGDIELIVRKIPGVSEVAVLGRPMKDCAIREAAAAFIVRAPNSNLSEQDVHDFFEKENVHFSRKLGGGVFFVDNMPKSRNGKILRRELRERLLKLPVV